MSESMDPLKQLNALLLNRKLTLESRIPELKELLSSIEEISASLIPAQCKVKNENIASNTIVLINFLRSVILAVTDGKHSGLDHKTLADYLSKLNACMQSLAELCDMRIHMASYKKTETPKSQTAKPVEAPPAKAESLKLNRKESFRLADDRWEQELMKLREQLGGDAAKPVNKDAAFDPQSTQKHDGLESKLDMLNLKKQADRLRREMEAVNILPVKLTTRRPLVTSASLIVRASSALSKQEIKEWRATSVGTGLYYLPQQTILIGRDFDDLSSPAANVLIDAMADSGALMRMHPATLHSKTFPYAVARWLLTRQNLEKVHSFGITDLTLAV